MWQDVAKEVSKRAGRVFDEARAGKINADNAAYGWLTGYKQDFNPGRSIWEEKAQAEAAEYAKELNAKRLDILEKYLRKADAATQAGRAPSSLAKPIEADDDTASNDPREGVGVYQHMQNPPNQSGIFDLYGRLKSANRMQNPPNPNTKSLYYPGKI